jgi:NTP pyrophosphatase (non-canonical NTP hydrolase)
MDTLEYQVAINESPTGTEDHLNLTYATLGLCGAAADIVEKYLNYTRTNQIKIVDLATRETLATELGDFLWYLSRIIDIIGVDYVKDLEHPVFPSLTDPTLVAFNLQMKAGQVAKLVKKYVRENGVKDDGEVIVLKDQAVMIMSKFDPMITMLQVLSSSITLSLKEVAQINLDKVGGKIVSSL